MQLHPARSVFWHRCTRQSCTAVARQSCTVVARQSDASVARHSSAAVSSICVYPSPLGRMSVITSSSPASASSRILETPEL